MGNWKKMFECCRQLHNDTSGIEYNTMTEEEMSHEFDDGYGYIEGIPFTIWTKERVYFPVVYDGSEWVGSVSRNPDKKPTKHQGGS
jgi:hypothetical protein